MIHSHKLLAPCAKGDLQVTNLNERLTVWVLMRMMYCRRGLRRIHTDGILHGRRLFDFRCTRIKIPCFRLVRRRNIEKRWFFLEINIQRMTVAGSKCVTDNLVEQVRRRAVDGGQLFPLDAQLRQCRQQRPCVGMPRIVENFLRHTDLNDLSRIHHRHTVGDIGNNAEIVSNVDDGHAKFALKPADQVKDLCLNSHIECSGWFITNEYLRMTGYGNRNNDTLTHTA